MNHFGGDWTDKKIEILIEYANAYLTIMKDRLYWKLLYFDGFAGTGFIDKGEIIGSDITIGAARRIVEIDTPRSFDQYYFVEKVQKNYLELYQNTKGAFSNKSIAVINDDCNKKLIDMAEFLKSSAGKNHKVLAYIDPCGMQLEWNSISILKGLPIDMWVLVPTGLGVNRLLAKNGEINQTWMRRLQVFLGLSKEVIENYFYQTKETLFEDIIFREKYNNAVSRSALLYYDRLKEIFTYVTKPYELKNSSKSIMYHLYLASNNQSAIKIGNDIIRKYKRRDGTV